MNQVQKSAHECLIDIHKAHSSVAWDPGSPADMACVTLICAASGLCTPDSSHSLPCSLSRYTGLYKVFSLLHAGGILGVLGVGSTLLSPHFSLSLPFTGPG